MGLPTTRVSEKDAADDAATAAPAVADVRRKSLLQSLVSSSSPPSLLPEHDWLLGVRGFLVIQSFVWVFLTVFAPATVKGAANTDGPLYQIILRKVFSVLFWNESLIYSFIVLLSARTICLPFLVESTRQMVASQVFRRGIRLWIPTAVAFGLSTVVLNQIGLGYIDDFKTRTGNVTIETPERIQNFLNWFNSMFEIFWVNKNYATQMGSLAFPSQTLFTVSIVFVQSYTVYMTMVCIPYTRNSWRVKAFLFFIATAWWVQSWAWYSVTGVLLADVVMNMDFKAKALRGIPLRVPGIGPMRCPSYIAYAALLIAGLVMEYLWTAWRPQYENAELKGHTGLYNAGSLNDGLDLTQPLARDDNYLVIVGFMLMLETSDVLQWIFKNPLFTYLGRRSFSYFLIQATVIYTAGIKLFLHLRIDKNWPEGASNIVCLAVCLVTVVPGAELFYRVVDYPSQVLARVAWDFMTE
ncbi:uncharacterized protein BKCO1_3800041 [Diplodia corticola]|uniref:Uncharacterized protein n=1 Tax=Diplodia corticola TaxID=236234 RepID=A0A1J9QTX3_9PEZI|nr:uncharacterized protein BKCO1_3800041 [Diplodia corticola]OJD32422.1 hypothetical protein BKCO1_3800041 [Diplodia corticola]